VISVLLNVAPDGGHEARLQAALALVKAHGGHLTCAQVVSDVPVAPDPIAAATEVEALAEMEDVARQFQRTVEPALEASGAGWTWLRLYGDPATILIERSRFADVIVMSTEDSFPPISSVALHTRTPILAVLRGDPNFMPVRTALVAWNGSASAAHAVRGAMPLLESMRPVLIVPVDGDSEEFPASLVQQYLHEHQIPSTVYLRSSNGASVAEAILDYAETMHSGLIVAGAFGHNRLREMLLGSVTRELLEKSSRPLLLSH
jgi:nucleotide-binding universal stress UspA family protein